MNWHRLSAPAKQCATERLKAQPVLLTCPPYIKLLWLPVVWWRQTRISWRYRPRLAAWPVQVWFALLWGARWTLLFLGL